MAVQYSPMLISKLNSDISQHFNHLFEIQDDYELTFEGVSRLVMLDRYAQKDLNLVSLSVGDLVICIVKDDPKFPARGIGYVKEINYEEEKVTICLEEDYRNYLDEAEAQNGIVVRHFSEIDKPLELFFEQIAKRVGTNIASSEKSEINKKKYADIFAKELASLNIIPAGRVLYGAGSGTEVTYFNCFVMPFVKDSRGGIADHRKEVMEIMSRGGGVGTNGSTLRPKGASAKGVGGKSSGAVSWLNDIANLTNLVEQGGSRRGAQMIMLADWHPDIIEFIISKMQNPNILLWLSNNSNDEEIRKTAKNKLQFVSLTTQEVNFYQDILDHASILDTNTVEKAREKLFRGGTFEVKNPDFLTGANISVCLTDEFMEAIKNDEDYELRFPDLDSYTKEEKAYYDQHWHEVGDVREWEQLGYKVKTYRKIKARDLWDLICFCATYSAEPGIFFIDNANKMTNAKAYGQKVVATNPCGEQPLAPYSVCNLSAINLSNFVDKKKNEVLFDKLAQTVKYAVRMQDNVIDATPYFLEQNRNQALGERRIGLGVMGLHDLLIWCGKRYGSNDANEIVDKVFECIATSAYKASIELAKEKGSFPFLEDKEAFINTGYMKKMNEEIRQDILKYGIRNSHLLTIAPTGSTGTMVGVSTGLEPYFSFSYYRSGRLGKFIEVNADIVEEWLSLHPNYTKETLPDYFVSAMDLTPEEHADTQCIIQRWIDSSISKTVNAPKGFTVRNVQEIYRRLYEGGAKGGTVYVDGSRDSQVLTLTKDDNDINEQLTVRDFGIDAPVEKPTKEITDLRSDRLDREIGNEVGNICPICLEGIVTTSGGCNTCPNCGAQLKCGL
ncbi:TPA: vitamin B12-dependent ribonucleotide reductase [bacterium]|nr:vitamin B12-dependent ribonucleotide reductase [bacterium]